MSVYQQAKGSIVLKTIIVLLVGVLIWVLYEPYQVREREEYCKKESRIRLQNIRTAQLRYIENHGRYADSIATLVDFIKQSLASDTTWSASMFKPLLSGAFVPESLLNSPKSWKPYAITAVDTTAIKKYLVEDPDGYGSIGSLTDDSKINKASWED
ncbi:MAG TPA: hypothetical protein DCP63_06085 [Bacteroidetes bacterium]|nr:hypothetical protein [Bacteroidota bacterium]